jgi:hypothetical protein
MAITLFIALSGMAVAFIFSRWNQIPIGLFPAARTHADDPHPLTPSHEPVAQATGFWSFIDNFSLPRYFAACKVTRTHWGRYTLASRNRPAKSQVLVQ